MTGTHTPPTLTLSPPTLRLPQAQTYPEDP